ncbi:MAG: TonB-dependent receptor [Planctomycetaceae bacterium]|nr:TonB-dependent receptor [Planctomycetaceae bacterium]
MRRWLIHFGRASCGLLLLALVLRASDEAGAEQPVPQGDYRSPFPIARTLEVGELTFAPIELPPAPRPEESLRVDAITLSRIDDVMQFGDWVSPAPQIPGVTPGQVFRLAQIEAEQPFDIAPPSFATEAFQPFDVTGGIADRPAGFGSFGLSETYHPLLDEQVGVADQLTLAVADAGALLAESGTVQTVSVQQRSPVAFDPHVRGYNFNQIYTVGDGAFWTPVREDLDSMLAKIDPSLISQMVVIPGPYGLRYGPGFSFIDVVTVDTPRYDGYEAHNRFGLTYHGNGERVYGRDTFYGGNSNYGFVVSYGNRTGNDYEPGDNAPIGLIPSSYHNQNFLGQLGFDLSPDSTLELRYTRMDQANTEYAAQFFDVNALVTDGFNVAWNHTSPVWDRSTKVEAWYNTTRFYGDTERANKRSANFPVISRVEAALPPGGLMATTSGDLASTGARTMTVWGADENPQLTLGADIRHVDQALREDFTIPGAPPDFFTNIPRAELFDPGAFAELSVPVTDYWTTKVGARIDIYESSADSSQLRFDTSLPDIVAADPSTFGLLDRNEELLAFYLTNDVEVNDNTTLRFGGGHAQRAPTLRERYADGVFLGIIQSGFSRVIGNPALRKERAWQIDAGIDYESDIWRGKVHAFGSWIDDYITYTGNVVSPPLGARLLQTINTDYATLAGFEAAGEVNLTPMLSTYGSISYVDGRDHGIDRPLSQIAPLEGRVGIRWHDPSEEPRWGTDFGIRIVDNQDMVGFLHAVGGGAPVEVEVPTAGFTTAYLRGFYNFSENVNLVGGIENLFDNTYLEHLDLRLPDETIGASTFANTAVFSPGITPYIGVEWTQ